MMNPGMMDMEDRVRGELEALAQSVPPSRDPWAEHLARVARRRTRVLAVVAAAAVVVAAVVIPSTVRLGAALTPPAMHLTDSTPPTATEMPMGSRYRSAPAALDFAKEPPVWVAGAGDTTAWVYTVESRTSAALQVCLGVVTWDGRSAKLVTVRCTDEQEGDWVQAWPIGAAFPDVVVFVGGGITNVDVHDDHGEHVSTSPSNGLSADVYVADFEGGSTAGAVYVAEDVDGGRYPGHL